MTVLTPETWPRFGLWTFGDTEPTVIEEADPASWRVRLKVKRIAWKASRIQRTWVRKHGGMERQQALNFAFWELSKCSPKRWDDKYRFVHFGMGGPLPSRRRLSEWCEAYALLTPAQAMGEEEAA